MKRGRSRTRRTTRRGRTRDEEDEEVKRRIWSRRGRGG